MALKEFGARRAKRRGAAAAAAVGGFDKICSDLPKKQA